MTAEKQALLERVIELGKKAKIDNEKTKTFGGGGHLPESGTFEIREESVIVDKENPQYNHYRLYVEGYPLEFSISLSSLVNSFYSGSADEADFAQGKKNPEMAYLKGNTPGCVGRPLPGNANNKRLLEFFDGMKFVGIEEFKTLTLPFDTKGDAKSPEGKDELRKLLKPGTRIQVELEEFIP